MDRELFIEIDLLNAIVWQRGRSWKGNDSSVLGCLWERLWLDTQHYRNVLKLKERGPGF